MKMKEKEMKGKGTYYIQRKKENKFKGAYK